MTRRIRRKRHAYNLLDAKLQSEQHLSMVLMQLVLETGLFWDGRHASVQQETFPM